MLGDVEVEDPSPGVDEHDETEKHTASARWGPRRNRERPGRGRGWRGTSARSATVRGGAQTRRSVLHSLGRVPVLLYTANWWRKARFSRASWRWRPQRNGNSRTRWSSVLIMARDSRRIRGEDQSLGRRTGFWRGTGVPEPMPWRDRIGGVILEGDGFLFGGVIISRF